MSNEFGLSRWGADKVEYKGFTIKIEYDDVYCNPRREMDPYGELRALKREYSHLQDDPDAFVYTDLLEFMERMTDYDRYAGDEDMPDEWHETIIKARFEAMFFFEELGVYDYGSNGMKISSPHRDNVDAILFINVKDACAHHMWEPRERVGDLTQEQCDHVKKVLDSEVKFFNQYLQGDVYGAVIEKDGKVIESCWGFYGDHDESGIFDFIRESLPEENPETQITNVI